MCKNSEVRQRKTTVQTVHRHNSGNGKVKRPSRMLISKYLIAILLTIVSKYIYKPCESVNNLYSLKQGRQSFLQSTGDETDTPQSVKSGETVEVASNKTGNGQSPTADESKDDHKEEGKDLTTGQSEGGKQEDKGASAGESEVGKGTDTAENKTEPSKEAHHDNEEHSDLKGSEAKSHHGGHKHEEPDLGENEHEDEHGDEDEDHETSHLLGTAVGGSQAHGASHRSNPSEEKHEPAPAEAAGHSDHTETHHNQSEHAQSHLGTSVVHPHVTQGHTNEDEAHGHGNEKAHSTEQHHQEEVTEVTKNESTEEKKECDSKEGSCENPQTFPKESGTAEVAVEPHKEAESETGDKHHVDAHGGHEQTEKEEGEQETEPEEYKVDLKKLTDDQKKAIEDFYSKPDGQCPVDCEHSCKSALGGKTQCVSSTESSVSCSTFQDTSTLTCPKNYTPCVQPVVRTLKSFTVKSGDEEVGQVEVDGSNFNKCMGLALAPKNGSCEKDKLLYNLLFTSGALNLDYKIDVGSDKLTFSNLKIKNGEYKVCVFNRYVGDTSEGTLANFWAKVVEFFDPTKQAHHPNKAVFSLEVGSLKVTD